MRPGSAYTHLMEREPLPRAYATRARPTPVFGLTLAWALVLAFAIAAHAHGIPPRLAGVMAEVGERFASLGAAIASRNDDLARYQVRQISELLERDLVLALPPRPLYGMDLDPLRSAFREGPWRALRNAVDNHDLAAAATAFEETAAACNECHRTTSVPFLTVPGLPQSPKTTAKGRKPAAKGAAQPATSAPATTKSNVESAPPR